MSLDWTAFTPWRSLLGGMLIGLSAALLILFNGRVAGVSGILGAAITSRPDREGIWRWHFIAGVLAAAPLWWLVASPQIPDIATRPAALVIAGLLVGLGTRFGSGCTSGHGVCGMSRGSLRSIVATGTFIAFGFATVYLVRHG